MRVIAPVTTICAVCLVAAGCASPGLKDAQPDPDAVAAPPSQTPARGAPGSPASAIAYPTAAPLPSGLDAARTMRAHLLDVGQGAATLFEFPCGAMLIDTGGELNDSFDVRVALKAQLDAFFARRADLARTIDLLVITHPHIDHMRGLPTLLENFRVKNVVDNSRDGDSLVELEQRALRTYIEDKGAGHRRVRLDDIVKRGGLTDEVIDPIACEAVDPKIRVLWGGVPADPGWGTDHYGKMRFDNENNHSVVVRVDFGAASMLVTGDLEEIAIRALIAKYEGSRWLDVDVYQAGHHGSANGTTRELLTAMTPRMALIAMGDPERHHSWTAWAYGHPRAVIVDMLHDRVLMDRPATDVLVGRGTKRFEARTIHRAIFGTGWDGAVVIDATAESDLQVRLQTRRRD
jgi:competence protein ComEC